MNHTMNLRTATLSDCQLLADSYFKVRNKTTEICAPLKTEDYVVQPIGDVSPPKWHLGHTTWFFETFVLQPYLEHYKVFHKDFGFVFNSYYEAAGKRVVRTNRGNLTRPTVEEVLQYRKYVDKAMDEMLGKIDALPEKVREIMTIGLHHEQQHQELLIYDIKYILGNNPLLPAYENNGRQERKNESLSTNYLQVPEGLYEIGHSGEGFSFDNELGKHKVYLNSFQVMDRLITNKEYQDFIKDGGYSQFKYWLSEGWEWVKANDIKAPLYWHQIDGVWYNYTLSGMQHVDPTAPVTHISFFEADAFANWAEQRLPTEFEWETACKLHSPDVPEHANFQDSGLYAPTSKTGGNPQFYGDVWEWTSSAYRPYPYFKTAEGALGEYNGKFMINQMVLRGGSCATPRNHIRATYRNFFHPHLRWHFTGIRLARDI